MTKKIVKDISWSITFVLIFVACSKPNSDPTSTSAPTTIATTNAAVELVDLHPELRIVKTEIVTQPNCGGSTDLVQTIEKVWSVTHTIEVGGEFTVSADGSVSIPGIAEVGLGVEVATQLGYSYGKEEATIREIVIGAAPGTTMEHTILFMEEWQVGTANVTVNGQDISIPFKFQSGVTLKYGDGIDKGCLIEATQTPTSLVPTTSSSPSSGIVFFNQGVEAFEEGNYEEAIEEFTNAIDFGYEPQSEIYFYLGRSYHQIGNYSRAVSDYTRAIELNYEPLSEAFNRRGLAYHSDGDFARAIIDFTQAIELNHEPLSWPYVNRGNSYHAIGDYEHAIESFTQAINLNHGSLAYVYALRGISYSYSENYEQALQDFDKSIELNGPTWVYTYRGEVYAEQNNHEVAIENYTAAIELETTDIYAYWYRGRSYQALGNQEAAIADFQYFLTFDISESWRKNTEQRLIELQATLVPTTSP